MIDMNQCVMLENKDLVLYPHVLLETQLLYPYLIVSLSVQVIDRQ